MSSGWRQTLQYGLGSAYQIRQELGGGGMSAVYIAEETALGRSVVLKALSPELAAGLNVERFNREIHLAARLQHAFIVPLLAAGVSDGQPWYTMPLIQGEALRARIAREGALSPNAAARILRDVAEALAYAHGQGVVHRDIKPDNILLSGAHALVTDFGVAKALSVSSGAGSGVTGVGMAIGTPAYMAPEQAAGDPATDHRADLYALGVTAYEMLTGRPLFGARAPAQMLMAHATERPDSLTRVAPAVPIELAALVDQLLAKHPNDRPAHAEEVADSLTRMITRWTSGEIAPMSRVTFGRAIALWIAAFIGVVGGAWLAERWLPVPPWTLAAAVVLMLAALPVLALTAWLHRPARPISPIPSVASTTTVGRIEAIARPHLTWRRAKRGGVVAIGALALVAAGWTTSRSLGIGPAATLRTQGKVAPTDQVFVADFDSPPSDTGLGLVVADLLRTEISRSRSIRLVSANARARTLLAMARPASQRIGESLAPEFAQRANAKVYLTGSITQLGTSFLLRANLVETSTGAPLGTFKASARSADDVIQAVDHMGREIRDRLGASLREVRGAPALSFAVTPSLAAARFYTEGVNLATSGDQSGGLHLLERAVQTDTEFAMAFRRMASFYDNLGNRERAAWAAERAFRFRARLPDPAQRVVEGTYYFTATNFDLDKSIAAYEAETELFGPDAATLNNLGLDYRAKRDFERSLATWREGVRIDTTSIFASTNILTALWATNRKDEARSRIATTLARQLRGSAALINARANLASAEFKTDSAERILEEGIREQGQASRTRRAALYAALAAVQRTRGRVSLAQRSSTEAASLDEVSDTAARVPSSALHRAKVLIWDRAKSEEGRRLLDSVVAAHPSTGVTALGYPWTDLATTYAQAGDVATARRLVSTYEKLANVNTKTRDKQDLELARGWIAVAEKRYADAVTAFRAADVYSCTICALPPLAHAYDLAGQADSSIAVFERYLATNYFLRREVDQTYLAGTYKRLGELYEAKGNDEKAREYYSRFIDLWRDADAELQPRVSEARQRLAVLRAKERR